MRKVTWMSLLLLLASQAWAAVSLAGYWQGTLAVPTGTLRVVAHVTADAQGQYSGTLASPDQGVQDIPIDEVILTDGTVRLYITAIGGVFTGKLAEDGNTILGTFAQQEMEVPLTLTRTETPPVRMSRPQEPTPPYPYNVETVSYANPAVPGVTLAGTLTLPNGTGPFPAVLLTGSYMHDRDGTIVGHKLFLVIADALTRRGIAVLRVDDRGVGKSTGDLATATTVDFASDALAGVQYLKRRKEIAPTRIGLIGYDEGGLVAPMVAVQSRDVAFIVLLAGPGIPGDQQWLVRSELMNRAAGESEELVARNRAGITQLIAILQHEPDPVKARSALRQVLQEGLNALSDEERTRLGNIDKFIDLQISQVLTPQMRFFLTYDPAPTLAQVRCPLLALNGEHDLQVPYRQNLAGILTAYASGIANGGTVDITARSFPGLNHLFQECETGSPAEYGTIEETFSPQVLQVIGDWITARTPAIPAK